MTTLLEKLAQKKTLRVSAEAEKKASIDMEKVFTDAFIDEFIKTAQLSEMQKEALFEKVVPFASKAFGAVKNVVGGLASKTKTAFNPPVTGGQIYKKQRQIAAAVPSQPAIAPNPEFKSETPGSFPLDRETRKYYARKEKFNKLSSIQEMDKKAIGFLLPALAGAARFFAPKIMGAFGRKAVTSVAAKAPSLLSRVGGAANTAMNVGMAQDMAHSAFRPKEQLN